jgi:hypothetical protein
MKLLKWREFRKNFLMSTYNYNYFYYDKLSYWLFFWLLTVYNTIYNTPTRTFGLLSINYGRFDTFEV